MTTVELGVISLAMTAMGGTIVYLWSGKGEQKSRTQKNKADVKKTEIEILEVVIERLNDQIETNDKRYNYMEQKLQAARVAVEELEHDMPIVKRIMLLERDSKNLVYSWLQRMKSVIKTEDEKREVDEIKKRIDENNHHVEECKSRLIGQLD